jgi:hypothetical protein
MTSPAEKTALDSGARRAHSVRRGYQHYSHRSALMLKKKLRRFARNVIETSIDSAAILFSCPDTRQAFRKKLRPHKIQPPLNTPTKKKLESIKGIKKGERCILVGTAPSINLIDLSKITDEFIFLVNRGYLLRDRFNKDPDAIMLANPYAFAEYGEFILSQYWDYIFLSCEISDKKPIKDNEIWFSQWEYPRMDEAFFQPDCTEPLYHANTVVLSALQIAVWMGFSEIIIVGVDLSFDEKKPHFYKTVGNELHRSKSVSMGMAGRMLRGFQYAAQYIDLHSSSKVYNAGIGGNLECFPRIDWNCLYP